MDGGPPCFPPGSSCPVVLWYQLAGLLLRLRDFYPLRFRFPTVFYWITSNASCWPATPYLLRRTVWTLPISLAATLGISVDFLSSGYLDVSVHRVPSVYLCIHYTVTALSYRRVSPFGYLWIYVCLQLPTAFRSLPRPSSALDAKAFSMRSS